uniref:Uncharacterized protein n=1 Tax=Timema poppense TaxID=170557 RepID=A0A7R9DVJ2_TIMPO|nr:unnamed protein product [Timema poppensis]
MSFDALETWINSDNAPIPLGEAAQRVDPNSLEQLLYFTEDGVCTADYWDPYALNEGLQGSVATGVTTSTPPEDAPPVGCITPPSAPLCLGRFRHP